MKQWEYRTFARPLSDGELNELGEYGWELVSHTAAVNNRTFGQYYIFKREIPE